LILKFDFGYHYYSNKQNIKLYIEIMSTTTNVECGNCKAYGIFTDGELSVPCTNCAQAADWSWNGEVCYGSQDGKTEFTLHKLVGIYYHLVRVRMIRSEEYTSEQSVDDHIMDNILPNKARGPYTQYVEARKLDN